MAGQESFSQGRATKKTEVFRKGRDEMKDTIGAVMRMCRHYFPVDWLDGEWSAKGTQAVPIKYSKRERLRSLPMILLIRELSAMPDLTTADNAGSVIRHQDQAVSAEYSRKHRFGAARRMSSHRGNRTGCRYQVLAASQKRLAHPQRAAYIRLP